MTKDDLIKVIAENLDRPRKEVALVLDALSDAATAALQRGEAITLVDMVKLTPYVTNARTGRNPRTGLPVEIPAKKTAKAKVTAQLGRTLA